MNWSILSALTPLLVVFAGVLVLGNYIAKVLEGKTAELAGLKTVEGFCFRVLGIDPKALMTGRSYFFHLCCFNLLGFLVLFGLLSLQGLLPLNPNNFPNLSPSLALEIASSFVTNTNWQSYVGENTLSHFSTMLGVGVQNFLAPGVGLAVFHALVSALRKKQLGLENFYASLFRGVFYVLLPLNLLFSVLLISQGVPANLEGKKQLVTVEQGVQDYATGPVAPMVASKMLGTNGGGYYGQNSAHPLENPTPFSNFLELLMILLIPAGLCYTYGRLVGRISEGMMLLGVFSTYLVLSLAISFYSESLANPYLGTALNWEGKEWMIGRENSVVWSVITTLTSSGSANVMLSSMSPLSGGISLTNMLLGEVMFGGVGSGLYGAFLFILFTVFLGGLMIGRSPVYLGKKVEPWEIRLAVIGLLIPNTLVLLGSALVLSLPTGQAALSTVGPHGLTEIIYAFASTANNNGSAFAGLSAALPFLQVLFSLAMLIGRFGVIACVVFIASNLANKPTSTGVNFFSTQSLLFAVLFFMVILLFSVLTYFPILSLGPILEHFLMLAGKGL